VTIFQIKEKKRKEKYPIDRVGKKARGITALTLILMGDSDDN
jgi:hypothetical protein